MDLLGVNCHDFPARSNDVCKCVVQDISERLWGLKFHGYFSTQTPAGSLYDVENKNTADFIPRTRACMLSNTEAVIIAFRGSEPLNLINLRSSGKWVLV